MTPMMHVKVREDGIVEFVLINPLPADSGMKVDPVRLAALLAEVEQTLTVLDIKTNAAPATSFRPATVGFELYKLTAAIPGTVQMRHAKKGWPPRKKKITPA